MTSPYNITDGPTVTGTARSHHRTLGEEVVYQQRRADLAEKQLRRVERVVQVSIVLLIIAVLVWG